MLKKSLFFVIICLLFGALSTQLSAQTEVYRYDAFCYTEVHCDGEFLGWIYGPCSLIEAAHFKDGEWVFSNYIAKGQGECTFLDESFKYFEKAKVYPSDGIADYVVQLVGTEGSIFHLHLTIDYNTTPATWTTTKAICR